MAEDPSGRILFLGTKAESRTMHALLDKYPGLTNIMLDGALVGIDIGAFEYCVSTNNLQKSLNDPVPETVFFTGKLRQYGPGPDMTVDVPDGFVDELKSYGVKNIVKV